jgi:hypothetical protein
MINRYYCYYFSSSEYEEIRKNRSLPHISYPANIFVEPIEHYDAESFRALIGCKSYNKDWAYNTPSGIITYPYYTDKKQGNPGVFTFDSISFYNILNYYFTIDGKVEVNLRRINTFRYNPNKAFMLMPFKDTLLKDFYENNIKDFLKSEMKIEILRSNDFCDNDVIIDTIYSKIENAELIIAEISEPTRMSFMNLDMHQLNRRILS